MCVVDDHARAFGARAVAIASPMPRWIRKRTPVYLDMELHSWVGVEVSLARYSEVICEAILNRDALDGFLGMTLSSTIFHTPAGVPISRDPERRLLDLEGRNGSVALKVTVTSLG